MISFPASDFSAIKAAGSSHYDILGLNRNWNGGSVSVPLDDISIAIRSVVSRTGKRPNKISMSTDSFEAFINNDQVDSILANTSTKIIELNVLW